MSRFAPWIMADSNNKYNHGKPSTCAKWLGSLYNATTVLYISQSLTHEQKERRFRVLLKYANLAEQQHRAA